MKTTPHLIQPRSPLHLPSARPLRPRPPPSQRRCLSRRYPSSGSKSDSSPSHAFQLTELCSVARGLSPGGLQISGAPLPFVSHHGSFHLTVHVLDLLAAHSRRRIWIKPDTERSFLFGNSVPKSSLARITENTKSGNGVVLMPMSDVPLGFSITTRSAQDCRKANAIAAARRRCLAQVKKHGTATATMIHEGIQTDDPRAGYDEAKVREILGTMVLEKELEEFSNAGSDKQAWYRVAEKELGGAMEAISCGVCPRIGECSPEGIVSSSTCLHRPHIIRRQGRSCSSAKEDIDPKEQGGAEPKRSSVRSLLC